MVRDRGFEPLTPSVSRKCSTTELTAPPELTLGNCFSLSVMPKLSQKNIHFASRFRAPLLDETLDTKKWSAWPSTPIVCAHCCRLHLEQLANRIGKIGRA